MDSETATATELVAETIQCPLCLGDGNLKRSEVLDRLGVKDFARVAQLSAEEAFRLLQHKHERDDQAVWARFENELAKRTADIEQRRKDDALSLTARIRELESSANLTTQQHSVTVERLRTELETNLRSEQSENRDLSRRLQDHLKEITVLQERNSQLETRLSKTARIGRREEMDFAEEVQSWPGVWVSEKLSKHGDYLLGFRDPAGNPAEPRLIIDNKDKESIITESDIKKLIRDAKERKSAVGVLVEWSSTDPHQRRIDQQKGWRKLSPQELLSILEATGHIR